MSFFKMKKNGFTMLEIFVATAMMGLVMIGLANIFLACKRLILHSREKMSAAVLAAYYLDPLYMNVDQSQWSGADYSPSNPLHIIPRTAGSSVSLPSGGAFDSNFTVTAVPPAGVAQMRKVVLDITWSESE